MCWHTDSPVAVGYHYNSTRIKINLRELVEPRKWVAYQTVQLLVADDDGRIRLREECLDVPLLGVTGMVGVNKALKIPARLPLHPPGDPEVGRPGTDLMISWPPPSSLSSSSSMWILGVVQLCPRCRPCRSLMSSMSVLDVTHVSAGCKSCRSLMSSMWLLDVGHEGHLWELMSLL